MLCWHQRLQLLQQTFRKANNSSSLLAQIFFSQASISSVAEFHPNACFTSCLVDDIVLIPITCLLNHRPPTIQGQCVSSCVLSLQSLNKIDENLFNSVFAQASSFKPPVSQRRGYKPSALVQSLKLFNLCGFQLYYYVARNINHNLSHNKQLIAI